nr:uncharacterized protein LOC118681808 [Bactrocera oleae]
MKTRSTNTHLHKFMRFAIQGHRQRAVCPRVTGGCNWDSDLHTAATGEINTIVFGLLTNRCFFGLSSQLKSKVLMNQNQTLQVAHYSRPATSIWCRNVDDVDIR